MITDINLPKPAPHPCGSCPYRKSVPSGIWDASEYDKLPLYDGETWQQSPKLFLCHQHNEHLCAGWLACHDSQHLLALRINPVDPSSFYYVTLVPVFDSGAEAMAHGIADIPAPGSRARKIIAKIQRQKGILL